MRLTPQQIEETRAAMAKHGNNAAAVARELGLARSTVQNRVDHIRRIEAPTAYEQIHGRREKPRIRVPAVTSISRSDEPIYKVLAIGDHHDKPGRDKTRALWIGRHAAETRPNAIVSIGDWASLDSLSTHEAPGSQNDAERPPFHLELESLDESLSVFHRGIPVGEIPVFHTHGNHEHRAVRSANRQPKLNGDMPIRLDEVFSRYRWQTRPFGEFVDLYGVDFVHCPLNVMGREMGGENVERNIGIKSMRSLVFGHTHRANVMNITKVGQQRKLTVINLGTSMPWGTVEKYNGLSMTGWSYGIFELRIQAGQILSAKHFDMIELEESYA
jgi:predicted phosphodiesterase